MKKSLLLVALSVYLLLLWGQQNSSQIDSLIKKMLPEAFEVGISVYDLTAKKSLYNYRAGKLLHPVSTIKLLMAITALSRPEANEPFRTEVWHDGVIEYDTLQGNPYMAGGFNPEFGSQSMDSLIEEVITFSLSAINGQVYGDVSTKDSLYRGSGWAWDDTPVGYQPYLSPLMFCKGIIQVSVVPSTVQGDITSVSCQSLFSYYTMTNQAKTYTSSAEKLSFTRDRLTNGNNLLIPGNVTSIRKDNANIYNSPRFSMHAFLERLRGKGITTPQSYGFAELPRDSVKVERTACWNTSVQKVLSQSMKESDNLSAEAFLCRLGAQAIGKKQVAAEGGTIEIMKLIRRLGHDLKDYKVADGCGLFSYNYLPPVPLVDFLRYAYSQTEVFQMLCKSPPIGGVDGTLKLRVKGTPAFQNVHAKTGSFAATSAPAGYLKMKNGHEVAFATMNQNALSAARAWVFQDEVCEVIIGK